MKHWLLEDDDDEEDTEDDGTSVEVPAYKEQV